jgi:hypothetical protein
MRSVAGGILLSAEQSNDIGESPDPNPQQTEDWQHMTPQDLAKWHPPEIKSEMR